MQKLIRNTPFLLLSCCLWLVSLSASAVEVTGLYESELAVTSQGRAERQKVIRAALLEVLIKVSGNTRVALSPGIPQLLNRRNEFLLQYRYRSERKPAVSENDPPQVQQFLWVRFDKVALDTAMRGLELAIWGRNRPATLAWIAVEQNGQRRLLASSEMDELTETVLAQAKRRGIPLDLPLLDLEDQQGITVTDVFGGFQETILKASQRYSRDAVLVGQLRQLSSQRWQGRWTLILNQQEYNWSQQGDLITVINFGVDTVTSTLASNFARLPTNVTGQVNVLVTAVSSLDDYARSEQFLAGLDGVIDVEPEQIDKQSILYKVKLRGDPQSLLQAISLSSQSVLSELETKPVTENPQAINKLAAIPLLTFKLIK